MSRRKSIVRRGSSVQQEVVDSNDLESQISWLTSAVMGGMLHKRGRGRVVSFVKPWALRYVTINLDDGELTYHVDVNGSVKI